MAAVENVGGAPGAATDQGAGAGNTNSGGNPGPGAGNPPVAGQGGGQPTEKTFSFKEDRTDWVPRTRLNEVSGKLTKYEQENLTLKQQLELSDKRTRALAGMENPDPKKLEADEIRSAIAEMFPQLKALEGLSKDQLTQVLDAAQTARSASLATWERHALSVVEALEDRVARAMNAEKLTPTQSKSIRRAYREEAQIALHTRQQAVQNGDRESVETTAQDNDFIARHERGDKSLIEEFAKAFLDDWYEPARRAATTSMARRQMRPVPSGGRQRVPLASGQEKLNLNNKADFQKALLAARGAGQE